jgi:hypothetical protein
MAGPDTREKVMADELTFNVDRTKWVLRLLGCIAFVVAGYLLREETLFGWACMIFFGLLIPLYLVTILLPDSRCLRLDSEGFEMGSFFKRKRTKWTDVRNFELDKIGGFIVGGAKVIRIVNAQHILTMEDTIDDSYNVSLTEILSTLNESRKRYGPR